MPDNGELMNVFIYPNLKKPNSREYTEQACEILFSENARLCMETRFENILGDKYGISYGGLEECVESCDAIVVIGGDGTILRCSSVASRYDKPILGINCGTLGFMTSLECSGIEKLRQLSSGDYTVSDRMMLSVTVKKISGETITAHALNDAVLTRGEDCKIAGFEVRKSGSIISSLRADGVIFSTATGASAYSLSAGGPIIEPDMQCIEFSQICAHSLFSRPIIFSPDSQLSIHCRYAEGTHVVLTVDGTVFAKVSDKDIVEIERSGLTTKIIDLTGGSFFHAVNRKLMTPLKQ